MDRECCSLSFRFIVATEAKETGGGFVMRKRKMNVFAMVLLCVMFVLPTACGGNNNAPAPSGDSENSGSSAPAGTGSTTTPPAEVKTFKFAFPQPAESLDGKAYTFFAERVKELTNGSIIIELYPADTLMPTTEVIDALMSGELQMAHNSVSFYSPTVKELTPLEIPGAYSGARYLEQALLMDEADSLFQKYGLRWLSCAGAANYMTFTSTKKLVKAPDDLKGMNVRASGKWTGEAIKLWGGNPVTLATGEITTALERGTIDAVYCGDLSVCMPFKLYEMAKYISLTTMQEQFGGAVITQKAWDRLNQAEQEAMYIARDELMLFYEKGRLEGLENFKKVCEEQGVEVYVLTDEENKAFTDVSLTLMAQAEEVGGTDCKELATLLEELRVSQAASEYVPNEIPTAMR
jgi:TRAP-type C4-dicarboxylate transport system substrate-binding protein